MPTEQEVLEAARILACEAQSPAEVVLFGSFARGDAGDRSDLDFLVVEDRVESRMKEAARLRRALPRLGVPVDVVVFDRADADSRRQWPGSVVKMAYRDGRVLASSRGGCGARSPRCGARRPRSR